MEKTTELYTINTSQGLYGSEHGVVTVDVNDRGSSVEDKIKNQVNRDVRITLDGVSIGYGKLEPAVQEITVTETDMINNPDLADIGVKAGDVIGIEPVEEVLTEEVIAPVEEEVVAPKKKK